MLCTKNKHTKWCLSTLNELHFVFADWILMKFISCVPLMYLDISTFIILFPVLDYSKLILALDSFDRFKLLRCIRSHHLTKQEQWTKVSCFFYPKWSGVPIHVVHRRLRDWRCSWVCLFSFFQQMSHIPAHSRSPKNNYGAHNYLSYNLLYLKSKKLAAWIKTFSRSITEYLQFTSNLGTGLHYKCPCCNIS